MFQIIDTLMDIVVNINGEYLSLDEGERETHVVQDDVNILGDYLEKIFSDQDLDFNSDFGYWNGGDGYRGGGMVVLHLADWGTIRDEKQARKAVAWFAKGSGENEEFPSSAEIEAAFELKEEVRDMWINFTNILREEYAAESAMSEEEWNAQDHGIMTAINKIKQLKRE